MKLLNYLSTCLLLAVPVCSDRPFAPPRGRPHGIKCAAHFGHDEVDGGAPQMQLCPSGDCTTGPIIKLIMRRLEEVDVDAMPVHNKVVHFRKTNVTWTEFANVQVAGVNVSETSYNAVLDVGNRNGTTGTVEFNLTAQIFQDTASVAYANTTLTVPAGALKFTISMGVWPWLADTNMLQYGVQLVTRTKGGKNGPRPERHPRIGPKKLERMNLTDGMFMDSPVVVLLDNVPTNVNSTITDTEFYWQFPHYTTSLYYDPVVGSEDASVQTTTNTNPTIAPMDSKTFNAANSIVTVAWWSLLPLGGAVLMLLTVH